MLTGLPSWPSYIVLYLSKNDTGGLGYLVLDPPTSINEFAVVDPPTSINESTVLDPSTSINQENASDTVKGQPT